MSSVCDWVLFIHFDMDNVASDDRNFLVLNIGKTRFNLFLRLALVENLKYEQIDGIFFALD